MAFQEVSHSDRKDLRDARARKTFRQHRPGVADDQSASRLYRDDFASLVELPLIGPPRQRIAQINAGVVLKAVWMVRTTVPLQIARCRYCDDLQVGQLAHDQG